MIFVRVKLVKERELSYRDFNFSDQIVAILRRETLAHPDIYLSENPLKEIHLSHFYFCFCKNPSLAQIY